MGSLVIKIAPLVLQIVFFIKWFSLDLGMFSLEEFALEVFEEGRYAVFDATVRTVWFLHIYRIVHLFPYS